MKALKLEIDLFDRTLMPLNFNRVAKAVWNGDVDEVDTIFNNIHNKNYAHAVINRKDQNGNTLLIFSAAKGDAKMVSLLLDHGADANAATYLPGSIQNGLTAIVWAILYKHLNVVKALLNHRHNKVALTNSPITYVAPIHVAIKKGNTEMVVALIEADKRTLNLRDEHVDETPLLWATRSGHVEIVLYLISQGAEIECTTNGPPTFNSLTPRQLANVLEKKYSAPFNARYSAIERLLALHGAKDILLKSHNSICISYIGIRDLLTTLITELERPRILPKSQYHYLQYKQLIRIRHWFETHKDHEKLLTNNVQHKTLSMISRVCALPNTRFIFITPKAHLEIFKEWTETYCPEAVFPNNPFEDECEFSSEFTNTLSILALPSPESRGTHFKVWERLRTPKNINGSDKERIIEQASMSRTQNNADLSVLVRSSTIFSNPKIPNNGSTQLNCSVPRSIGI